MNLIWHDWGIDDLNLYSLHDILLLRNQVFVVEQHCPYQDIDGRDLTVGNRHVTAYQNGKLVAYARILAPHSDHDAVKIGRVIVASPARGEHVGHQLMEHVLIVSARHWPKKPLFLSAQVHLQRFYSQFGFMTTGDVYDEDGIPHIDMRTTL
ncbi:GNAT family N-acetyltransferase [Pectobacteriaceae bacterium CE70]|uniref:Protein ElaA n=1 Tax=Serratia sp. (strain ATCC 39006) TaxID=104623 RepID=A0A2I5TH47_SERS3|nr:MULTISPECIES: GNAT family N-acetyltransferase [Enterobacterales]WJV57519.1 GNAT family N-acetyltransferase [Pectobacteriaceae bacterium C111]WJV61852.1 GNAT family N-acetyltransferase [Pectobacteriaceae bacterium C52]WJV66122.1 GNAT family N-acetyltransferase [Pectobacteriaceae bacterium CE70]WJY10136.1 GNAT family N-acetyltransferase [Pectobacteriaceae bacterium C80]WJY15812.1 GNAT family N-acetyltransferase [Pectobacteriaceae bacterium CE90]